MKVAIVGASLGGLAAATAFHKLGATVRVFEKFGSEFSKRGAGLGYVDVGLWERLRGQPMMRRGRKARREQVAFFYGDPTSGSSCTPAFQKVPSSSITQWKPSGATWGAPR